MLSTIWINPVPDYELSASWSVPDNKLTCPSANPQTHQRPFPSHSYFFLKTQASFPFIQTLFSFSTGTGAAIHLCNSLACTRRVELTKFIKGICSLMLSPLINLNSTSDRLSGTHKDTHKHTLTQKYRRWMKDVKRWNIEGKQTLAKAKCTFKKRLFTEFYGTILVLLPSIKNSFVSDKFVSYFSSLSYEVESNTLLDNYCPKPKRS